MPLCPTLRSTRLLIGLCAAVCFCGVSAAAQAADAAPTATAAQPAPTADSPAPPAARQVRLEGAVGVILAYRPEYLGASRSVFKLTPGVFLRYGRFTLSNAGNFATRRADDVVPGLGVDMVRNERTRLGLSLRVDQGRSENTASSLAGLGNIKPTVRLRAAGSTRVQGAWRVGAAWSADLLGRQGGGFGELNAGWETRLSPDSVLSVGAGLGVADRRYMQTYFGISPAQSAASGHPVYSPAAGWREAAVSASVRHDLDFGEDSRWIVVAGASATRLMGPAAASPLTTARNGWGLSLGVARQF